MHSVYRALMWAGGFWCHQIPERSPYLFGIQFPLCWRCTGIAAGALLLIIFILRTRRLPGFWPSLFISSLMPLDVFTAVAGLWSGHNGVRFVTGILWGIFGTAAALNSFLLIWERMNRGPSIDGGLNDRAAIRSTEVQSGHEHSDNTEHRVRLGMGERA
jgi:uncharacterized membrane protein